MGELTIEFAGICGHYKGVIDGVPHRVVMPDALGVHFGMVQWMPGGTPVRYCLLPHRVILEDDSSPLNAEFLFDSGQLLIPARLRVMNALDKGLDYKASYETVPRICDYVEHFTPSREVVQHRRAAAYFDVFGGVVRASQSPAGEIRVRIEMETDGAPVLGVTPFSSDESATEMPIQLKGNLLKVSNSDMNLNAETDKTFDFLLHYLAAEGGIPAVMKKPTPGLTEGAQTQSPKEMAKTLAEFASYVGEHGVWGGERAGMGTLNASCSDSQYP